MSSSQRFAAAWAAHELAEFLVAVSDCADEPTALGIAVERAAEAFEAEVGAVFGGDEVRALIGVPHHDASALSGVEVGGACSVELPGIGQCAAIAAGVDESQSLRLVIARAGSDPFTPEERGLTRSMARVLAMALRNFRLVNSLTERQNLLERLSVIQRSIAHRAELDDVLESITAGLVDLLGDDMAMIRLLDPEDPTRHLLVASRGIPDEALPLLRSLPLTVGVVGHAIREGRLVVSENYVDSPDRIDAAAALGTRAAMAAPVHEGGQIVGSLLVASHSADRVFSPSEREILLAFAEHASLALTDAKAIEGMERALYDPLTRLPNRAFFAKRLESALAMRRPGSRVAVLFVDLDRFKAVNDSLGHAAGDELLIVVGQRLTSSVRPSDTVARMGGDEFTVLLDGITRVEEAETIASRVLSKLGEPVTLHGRQVIPSASIGIAIDEPDCPAGGDLLHKSDVAMYHAKQIGQGHHATYRDALGQIARRRLDLETGLREALERGDLVLHHQPIVNLADCASVGGIEALLRWNDPQGAPAPVGELIAIAEETGLIVPLGRWVLEHACAAHKALSDLLGRPAPRMHVNVSAHQLRDRSFAVIVANTLRSYRMEPASLVIELTENSLVGRATDDHAVLAELRALGVAIAIDDFGQGYSSLGYLTQIDAQILKLDLSLIAQLGRNARAGVMLRHLIGMARDLGMTVVAEGIETEAQENWLTANDCDLGQGYRLHRPMPLDELSLCLLANAECGDLKQTERAAARP